MNDVTRICFNKYNPDVTLACSRPVFDPENRFCKSCTRKNQTQAVLQGSKAEEKFAELLEEVNEFKKEEEERERKMSLTVEELTKKHFVMLKQFEDVNRRLREENDELKKESKEYMDLWKITLGEKEILQREIEKLETKVPTEVQNFKDSVEDSIKKTMESQPHPEKKEVKAEKDGVPPLIKSVRKSVTVSRKPKTLKKNVVSKP